MLFSHVTFCLTTKIKHPELPGGKELRSATSAQAAADLPAHRCSNR